MCQLCDENPNGEYESCQDCGCLICFDEESGDDVIRPAYVTAGGDLFCDRCGRKHDQAEEDAADDEAFSDLGDVL